MFIPCGLAQHQLNRIFVSNGFGLREHKLNGGKDLTYVV